MAMNDVMKMHLLLSVRKKDASGSFSYPNIDFVKNHTHEAVVAAASGVVDRDLHQHRFASVNRGYYKKISDRLNADTSYRTAVKKRSKVLAENLEQLDGGILWDGSIHPTEDFISGEFS